MESIFRNLDSLEESQSHITQLIEQLDRESRQHDNAEVGSLLTGMEERLGQFSENHFELQREIEELLESSRRGVLSHEKLTEMVNAEQVRTSYLANIVSSLKSQIEGLFNKLVTVTDEESEGIPEPSEIVAQVSDNVNLLWKSVDSLSKLIGSPTKKLEYNIQKIDSEVIVHLNKTMHLAPVAESGGSLPEKIENQLKRKKTEKPKAAAGLSPVKETGTDKETAQYKKYGSQYKPAPSSATPNKGNNNNGGGGGGNDQFGSPQTSPVPGNRRGSVSPVPPEMRKEIPKKPLPPEQSTIHVEVNRSETFQTVEEVVAQRKKEAVDKAAAMVASSQASEQAYAGDMMETPSLFGTRGGGGQITPGPSQPATARGEEGKGGKARKRSRGNENHNINTSTSSGGNNNQGTASDSLNGDEGSLGGGAGVSETAKTGGKAGANQTSGGSSSAAGKGASSSTSASSGGPSGSKPASSSGGGARKGSESGRKSPMAGASGSRGGGHHSRVAMDDEGSVHSLTSAREDGFPRDRKALIKLLEEKEAKLQEQEKHFDAELKKRVMDYLVNHGIGFGANVPTGATGIQLTDSITSTENPSAAGLGLTATPSKSSADALDAALLKEAEGFASSEEIAAMTSPNRPQTAEGLLINTSTTAEGMMMMEAERAGGGGVTFAGDAHHSSPGSPFYQNYGAGGTGRNSKATSRTVSRVPSREGGGRYGPSGRYVLEGEGGGGNRGGPMMLSRQPSWKISRDPSFKGDVQDLRNRFRQLYQQDHPPPEGGYPEGAPELLEQATLEEIVTTIYSNLKTAQVNHQLPVDWNLIRLAHPAGKPHSEDCGTSMEDFEAFLQNRLYELPIFYNQEDILITRTYRPSTEGLSFEEQLKQSLNPLYLLYHHFARYLNPLQRDRLFYASLLATTKQQPLLSSSTMNNNNSSMESQESVEKSLAQRNRSHLIAAAKPFLRNAKTLLEQSQQLQPLIAAVETLVNDAVQIIKTVHRPATATSDHGPVVGPSVEYLMNSLRDLYRLIGILEAQEISVNLRLVELRAFFEQIQALHVKELEILLQESTEMNQAYLAFTSLQGNMLEIHRRFAASKERAKRYQLLDFLLEQHQKQQQQQLLLPLESYHLNSVATATSHPASRTKGDQPPLMVFTSPLLQATSPSGRGFLMGFNDSAPSTASRSRPTSPPPPHQQPIRSNTIRQQALHSAAQLTSMNETQLIRTLQEELAAAEEEIEDLEMELLSIVKERDQTPAAILFFSILQDPNIVSNLQQLLLQFKSIRQFLDYTENIDYLTLRKRLQVCLVMMPSIEKLVHKYSALYQQWSYYRLNWFAERKVRGSASEGMSACPLCYQDLSEGGGASHSHHEGVTGSKKEKKERGAEKGKSALRTSTSRLRKRLTQQLEGLSASAPLPAGNSQSLPLLALPSIANSSSKGSHITHKIPTISQSSK